MGNKESAPPVEQGPRILWPGRKYKRNIKERSEKYLQTILPVPPPEYFLRGSLQKLCLHALATELVNYIWQTQPEGADLVWAERLANLTPEIKLMLWNHMAKWHFTIPHPPIENAKHEIIWTFDANKHYDQAKQNIWIDVPRMVLNQLEGIEEINRHWFFQILGYNTMRPDATKLRASVLKRLRKLQANISSVSGCTFDRALKELSYVCKGVIVDLNLSYLYDGSTAAPMCKASLKVIADEAKLLRRLNINNFWVDGDDLCYFAENSSAQLESLSMQIQSETPVDAGLVQIAKKFGATLTELDIAKIKLESAKKSSRIFKYLPALRSICLGGHEYTDVFDQPRWSNYNEWGDPVPLSPEAQAQKDAFEQAQRERRSKGSATMFAAILKHCSTNLITLNWSQSDLVYEGSGKAIESFLTAATQLEELNLCGLDTCGPDGTLIELASQLPHLSDFKVSYYWSGLLTAHMEPLVTPGRFESLQKLELSALGDNLTDEFLMRLADTIAGQLIELSMGYNEAISDAGVIPLVQHAQSLLTLTLAKCDNLTNAVIIDAIAPKCTKLRELYLGSHHITSESAEHLSLLTDLETLDLSYCTAVEPSTLYKLAVTLPKIQHMGMAAKGRPYGDPWEPYQFALGRMPHMTLSRSIFY